MLSRLNFAATTQPPSFLAPHSGLLFGIILRQPFLGWSTLKFLKAALSLIYYIFEGQRAPQNTQFLFKSSQKCSRKFSSFFFIANSSIANIITHITILGIIHDIGWELLVYRLTGWDFVKKPYKLPSLVQIVFEHAGVEESHECCRHKKLHRRQPCEVDSAPIGVPSAAAMHHSPVVGAGLLKLT